ncbi:DUF397 domain-containing protein [Solihabitans fulvus]|uniref:DUF397 domain-containing protein n=1 Tax=Solihabitans fulvus TaxID=1892852 RepID=A0A5B2WYH3_9PSEU|nr:DUF397 domain-containing protein [Solihabitans fulvus]KAA2255469.1 DUF397 domain-containing protein [Solihabitans fulvus]
MIDYPTWRKSSRSSNQTTCVELSVSVELTSIRDTKNRNGGTLAFADMPYQVFLNAIKAGRFDR